MRVLVLVAALSSLGACAAQQPPSQGTAAFWKEFQSAAASQDAAKAGELTQFPFRTRGTIDSDPVKQWTRQEFSGLWKRLLASDTGMKREPEPMSALIERTPELKVTGSRARVGNFVFERADGKWRFSMAYLEE